MTPPMPSLTLRTMRTLLRHARITSPKRTIATTAQSLRPQHPFQPTLRTPFAVSSISRSPGSSLTHKTSTQIRKFTASPARRTTYNQVRRGCRGSKKARRARSPALRDRTQMKGVCLKTGVTKPKKPNSGERKTARVRLSSGRVITALIPGEGLSLSLPLASTLVWAMDS